MTPEIWALEGVLLLGCALVAYGLWPDREPRAPRRPARTPEHARWTTEGDTTRLADHWPVSASARVDPQCSCPMLTMDGRIIEPAKHYAGCPKAAPGERSPSA